MDEADKRVFLRVACLFSGELLQRAITLLVDGEIQGCLGLRSLAEKLIIEITDGWYIKVQYLAR